MYLKSCLRWELQGFEDPSLGKRGYYYYYYGNKPWNWSEFSSAPARVFVSDLIILTYHFIWGGGGLVSKWTTRTLKWCELVLFIYAVVVEKRERIIQAAAWSWKQQAVNCKQEKKWRFLGYGKWGRPFVSFFLVFVYVEGLMMLGGPKPNNGEGYDMISCCSCSVHVKQKCLCDREW